MTMADSDLSMFRRFIERHTRESYSQPPVYQDLWVCFEHFGPPGFFVEVGACDGLHLSNTRLLEEQGWAGILVEANPEWHERLRGNVHRQRRRSAIDLNAIWSKEDPALPFWCTARPELASAQATATDDQHANIRREGYRRVEVPAITLARCLADHHAPEEIAYLSLDTEGAELEILREWFSLTRLWSFRLISVEHNWGPNREKVRELMEAHGYERRFPELSAQDDFYRLIGPHR
jgi:FkbM family methyltransferase